MSFVWLTDEKYFSPGNNLEDRVGGGGGGGGGLTNRDIHQRFWSHLG